MPYTRKEIERMYLATDGREVVIGDETTAGHFVVEPEVQLEEGAGVLGDVPTLTLPQMVPGLRIDAELTVDLTAEDLALIGRDDLDPGPLAFRIVRRLPAGSRGDVSGETRLILEEA